MKTKLFVLTLVVALLVTVLNASGVLAQGPTGGKRASSAAMGTGFTYQGQLKKSGSPHTGFCDFQFSLWDAYSGGTQKGSVTANGVYVANGLFTRPIDFGSGMFDGDARWLEIRVQCTGDAGYTNLGRQTLTPAPYALALPGLYTLQNATSPNLIGGYNGNSVTSGVYGATIGGGGTSGFTNRVTDHYGTVGGGVNNTASSAAATVSGGESNAAGGYNATVGGGLTNAAGGSGATIGGGWSNIASNTYATVPGGSSNTASGSYATVPGGSSNTAAGDYSFAAGRRAKANHAGAFVWGDSTNTDVTSSFNDEFVIRATNGVRLTKDAGPSTPIYLGQYFRDNAIVAWGSIYANGTIDSRFGVYGVTRNSAGNYTITIDGNAANASTLIPIAIAEIDGGMLPNNAANVRIVSINQWSTTAFDVYITNGNWNLVDNDFVFIVTAR